MGILPLEMAKPSPVCHQSRESPLPLMFGFIINLCIYFFKFALIVTSFTSECVLDFDSSICCLSGVLQQALQ